MGIQNRIVKARKFNDPLGILLYLIIYLTPVAIAIFRMLNNKIKIDFTECVTLIAGNILLLILCFSLLILTFLYIPKLSIHFYSLLVPSIFLAIAYFQNTISWMLLFTIGWFGFFFYYILVYKSDLVISQLLQITIKIIFINFSAFFSAFSILTGLITGTFFTILIAFEAYPNDYFLKFFLIFPILFTSRLGHNLLSVYSTSIVHSHVIKSTKKGLKVNPKSQARKACFYSLGSAALDALLAGPILTRVHRYMKFDEQTQWGKWSIDYKDIVSLIRNGVMLSPQGHFIELVNVYTFPGIAISGKGYIHTLTNPIRPARRDKECHSKLSVNGDYIFFSLNLLALTIFYYFNYHFFLLTRLRLNAKTIHLLSILIPMYFGILFYQFMNIFSSVLIALNYVDLIIPKEFAIWCSTGSSAIQEHRIKMGKEESRWIRKRMLLGEIQ